MASLRLASRIRVKHPHYSRTFASNTSHTRSYAYVTLFALTAGVGTIYYLDSRAAVHRYLITPFIRHALDPETGHKLAVSVLESGLGPWDMLPDDERLKTEVKASVPRGNGLTHRLCSSGVKDCRTLSVSQRVLTKTAELLTVRISHQNIVCSQSVVVQGSSTLDLAGWKLGVSHRNHKCVFLASFICSVSPHILTRHIVWQSAPARFPPPRG